MGVEWVMNMESKISGRIKSEFPSGLKKKYGMTDNANFSTVGSSDTPAVFPFIYIQMLPTVERGRDLSGTSINAGLFTFQIEVCAKTSDVGKRFSAEILKIMKGMGFEATSMPSFENAKDVYRYIARYRRLIGEGDLI